VRFGTGRAQRLRERKARKQRNGRSFERRLFREKKKDVLKNGRELTLGFEEPEKHPLIQ